MNTCEARKGFLTLSGCENPAVRACSQCGQSMCSTHLTPQSGFTTCFDCAASGSDVSDAEYDDVWAHRYRSRYYSSTGYTPMAWSSRDYDQQDARSFDERETTLELVLPKKSNATIIHMAHLEDGQDRTEIQEQLERFLKKIHGKLGDVRSVVVYADKHKTRKYSLRTRVITSRGVIDAKAVGYDPISASKELVAKLDRRIKSEHSQIVKGRQHRESARRA